MEAGIFVFRVFLAALIGTIIGLITGREVANSRIFAIICMGSALVTITSTEFFKFSGLPWIGDPGRISAQVISALGFIGIGFIWVAEDGRIKDLPVAASLWIVAIMGLLAGAGMIRTAMVALLFLMLVKWVYPSLMKQKDH
ncbi:MAG: MgtC/SapB family protein [Syntrophomonas sp.]